MRIVILAPPGVQMLDVVGPAEVFWEAARRLGNMDAYKIEIVSTGSAAIGGTGSLRLVADTTIQDFNEKEPIDTLLVAGDPSFREIDPALTQWLRDQAPKTRRFGSICTGVFLLAAAGLLDGRRVTTHWECAERFRNLYPDNVLDADALYIRDGALITAAGVTAGIDLTLALVEEDFGREIAMIVARYMVVYFRRSGGQSQFSAHLVSQMSDQTSIQRIQQYILDNLTESLKVDELSREIGMSPRNFARVFRRETGMTPKEFVLAARIDAARRKLEDTRFSLKTIAHDCGFDNTSTMRRSFIRLIGVNPTDYRNHFAVESWRTR